MLAATTQKQSNFKEIQGSLTSTQFLTMKDRIAFDQYRAASESAVWAAGKNVPLRLLWPMPYQVIVVVQFPTSASVKKAFDAVNVERQAALVDICALLVCSNDRLPHITGHKR